MDDYAIWVHGVAGKLALKLDAIGMIGQRGFQENLTMQNFKTENF